MDGKHIRIEVPLVALIMTSNRDVQKPAHLGSAYWNYKHYHSIIPLDISDSDRRILAYDIGAPGRAGDAGLFRTSVIKGAANDRSDLRIAIPTFSGSMISIALHPDRVKRIVASLMVRTTSMLNS
ncbi:unnamed protein product [Cylicostephanus goldi]|uniref:DDE Tnp4 domain-containing protein n=1 Tax=Cylicostephanus goldi TaxID=71465 RepID=A0A3P7MTX5_CYLGO|nr:unnamed protein product [Cylicostephanus goldi]